MDTVDTISLILSYLDTFEIVKYSSINKLFYKAANNQYIWMNKLNYDFCHNGIFSYQFLYKKIYKKYYYINIQNYHTLERDCTKKISYHSQISKLPLDIKHVTQCYNTHQTKNGHLCRIHNSDYDGIGCIKLILFTEHLLKDSVINLINAIQLRSEGLYFACYNIGLMIMQKINKIELSEIHYEKDNLWCYEIEICFNKEEKWIPTLGAKMIKIKVNFINEHLLRKVCVVIDHISLNESTSMIKCMDYNHINLFIKKVGYLKFNDYIVNFAASTSERRTYCSNNYIDIIFMDKKIYSSLMVGIFIYLLEKNKIHTLPFDFDGITIKINGKIIELDK